MDSANPVQLSTILTELAAFFNQHQAPTYLVATSGGKDSMLLCELLRQLGLPIEIAHVNYGLRGEQSDLDQAFVTAYCQQHQLVLHVKKIDLRAQLQSKNTNLQAKARAIRYAFFEEIRVEKPNSMICTAHHADDQLETFWLQLARGAGLKGLAGMQRAQAQLLRPLLPYRQQTLQKLALELGLVWREDSSNASLKYRRNLWRLELQPFLRDQVPTIDQSVALLQKQFALEIQSQENAIQEALSLFNINSSIELNKISQLTSYQIVELFKILEVPTHVIRRIRDLFHAENGKYLTWKHADSGKTQYLVRQKDKMALVSATDFNWTFELHDAKANFKPNGVNKTSFVIDLQRVDGDLFLRKIQPGDCIRVSGMKGSKKVLQILKEMGIPAPLRKAQYVLCDHQKVISIPPYNVNAIVSANENTTEVAQLLFSKKT